MIKSIYADGVRSLKNFEHEFIEGITVICGPNGCGKTSLLESVHLLSQGFSFRAKDLKEMICWNHDNLILRGMFHQDITRALRIHKQGYDVKENGVVKKSPGAFFGVQPAVIMQPSDIELLRGAPEIRRRWIDEILCYRSRANTELLKKYKRILQQRNHWLKQYKKDGYAIGGDEMLNVLSEQLIQYGAQLWKSRIELSIEISPIITAYYRMLSNGVDEISCEYKSSILNELNVPDKKILDEHILADAFRQKLKTLKKMEFTMGMTMAGPHKDDLELCIGGYGMRSMGSQGQCRSAAVAMRFAAVDVATQYLNKPLLLLDDIFAELDNHRRGAVAELIREKACQVIIATPQAEDLPFKAEDVIDFAHDSR
ncbi:MAG: DNA replication/repair protein RecF [Fibrobacter sp.]|nr:DNA replication/repair protein RecF [Fibrobacter sp.]